MSRSEEFQTGRQHLDQPIGLHDDEDGGVDYTVIPAHANPLDGLHVIGIGKGDQHYGTMRLRHEGTVDWVEVKKPYQRQGHATRLWNTAKWLSQQFENFPEPKHSSAQTDEGTAWAKKVGD